MSIVLGIDPSIPPGRQVAVRRNMGGWKVVGGGDTPLREKPNQVVLSVPCEMLTFRTLSVPFTDRKRAEDVARQELANSLPMPLSEVRWSLCMLDKHQYLAVVSPRSRLDVLTETCKTRPDIVDAEPFSYARALASQDIKDGLVVDFADERTIFCLVRNTRPIFVRVLLRGGSSGRGLNPADLRDFLGRLVTDGLLPTLEPDTSVYVTGAALLLPELTTVLQETLQRSVKPFPLPAGLSSLTDVGAFGAALRDVYPDDGVDLMHHRVVGQPLWLRCCIAAAVLLVLWTLDLGVRQLEAGRRAAITHETVAQLLRTQTQNVASVKDLESKVGPANVAPAAPQATLLDILKTVSQASEKLTVRLQEIHYSEKFTDIEGYASTFPQEESLKNALTAVYKDLTLLDAHRTQDARVHFKFHIGAK